MEPTGPEITTPPPPPPPTDPREAAARQVNGPAIGLIVTAIVGAFFNLVGLLANVFNIGMATMPDLGDDPRLAMLMSGGIGVSLNILGLLIAVLVLFGALRMRKLRSRGLALTVSVLAMVPCVSPCCIIGLPIGIWALVALMRPEVKSVFAA